MSIKHIQPGQAGVSNVTPSWVYIETNDTYATVTTPGYLNGAAHEYINTFKPNMLAVVSTKTAPGIGVAPVVYILQITNTNGVWSLVGSNLATWTPVFTFATPGDLTVVYTQQVGWYEISGGKLQANFVVSFTPTFTTSSGNAELTGLPILSNAGLLDNAFGPCHTETITYPASCTYVLSEIQPSKSLILFSCCGSGVTSVLLGASNFSTGVAVGLQGTITYFL
jgi:hypothetical protein